MLTETDFGVSRETFEKLVCFCSLVERWNPTINLVSKASLKNVWRRHVGDSLFVARTIPGSSSWLDIGSGAGFPGVVVSILYQGKRKVTLVESDRRKAAFLKTAARELHLPIDVRNERAEFLGNDRYDVISARALAPLHKLFELSYPLTHSGTILVFPKGMSWEQEIAVLDNRWNYKMDVVKNPDTEGAVLLKITNLTKVQV